MSWKIDPGNSEVIVHRFLWLFRILGMITITSGLFMIYKSVELVGQSSIIVSIFGLEFGLAILVFGLVFIFGKLHMKKIL